MTDIKTLTFYKDKFTTARRNDPIPQLRCVGGSAKCSFTPKLIQCDNKASKGTLAIVSYTRAVTVNAAHNYRIVSEIVSAFYSGIAKQT